MGMEKVAVFKIGEKGTELKIENKKIKITVDKEEYKKLVYFVAYLIEREENALLIKESENIAYLLIKEEEEEDVFILYKIEGENYEEILDQVENFLSGHLPDELEIEAVKELEKKYKVLPIKVLAFALGGFVLIFSMFFLIKKVFFKKEEKIVTQNTYIPPPTLSKKEKKYAKLLINYFLIKKINDIFSKVDGNTSAIEKFVLNAKLNKNKINIKGNVVYKYLYPIEGPKVKKKKIKILDEIVYIFEKQEKVKENISLNKIKKYIKEYKKDLKEKLKNYENCKVEFLTFPLDKDKKDIKLIRKKKSLELIFPKEKIELLNHYLEICPIYIKKINTNNIYVELVK